jgi:hypothetical protein
MSSHSLSKLNDLMILTLIWSIGLLIGLYSFHSYNLEKAIVVKNQSENLTISICIYSMSLRLKKYLLTLFILQYVTPLVLLTLTSLMVFYQFNFGNYANVPRENIQIKNRKKVNIKEYYFKI